MVCYDPLSGHNPDLFAIAMSTRKSQKSGRQTNKASKLRQIMGDDIPEAYLAWYLRPNYDQTEVLIEPDGSVRGGTIGALVEQLTAHDHAGKLSLLWRIK